jgi:hypothetical protein
MTMRVITYDIPANCTDEYLRIKKDTTQVRAVFLPRF